MATRTIAKSKAAKKAKKGGVTADDYEKLFYKMVRAKKPVLPKDFAKAVDERLQLDWVRRASLVFLERPFKEMTEKLGEDRKGAVAFADLAKRIPKAIKRYRDLADMLSTAELRINMALCVRDDYQEVLKEAGRG